MLINASAISDRNAVPSIIFCGIRFNTYGPIKIPVTIYAVTFGKRNFLVILVIKNPKNNISAIDMIIIAISDVIFNFS